MSEESSDSPVSSQPAPAAEPLAAAMAIESPPPAAQPPRDNLPDPRARLLKLAQELTRTRNRRLLIEFLQLRRALR
jgi:hypothetical protein